MKINKTIQEALINQYIALKLSSNINNLLYFYNDQLSSLLIRKIDLKENIPILKKQLKALNKLVIGGNAKKVPVRKTNLQFNLGQKVQYLPIANQIDMLHTKITKAESDIDIIVLKREQYKKLVKNI